MGRRCPVPTLHGTQRRRGGQHADSEHSPPTPSTRARFRRASQRPPALRPRGRRQRPSSPAVDGHAATTSPATRQPRRHPRPETRRLPALAPEANAAGPVFRRQVRLLGQGLRVVNPGHGRAALPARLAELDAPRGRIDAPLPARAAASRAGNGCPPGSPGRHSRPNGGRQSTAALWRTGLDTGTRGPAPRTAGPGRRRAPPRPVPTARRRLPRPAAPPSRTPGRGPSGRDAATGRARAARRRWPAPGSQPRRARPAHSAESRSTPAGPIKPRRAAIATTPCTTVSCWRPRCCDRQHGC